MRIGKFEAPAARLCALTLWAQSPRGANFLRQQPLHAAFQSIGCVRYPARCRTKARSVRAVSQTGDLHGCKSGRVSPLSITRLQQAARGSIAFRRMSSGIAQRSARPQCSKSSAEKSRPSRRWPAKRVESSSALLDCTASRRSGSSLWRCSNLNSCIDAVEKSIPTHQSLALWQARTARIGPSKWIAQE